MKRLKQTSSRTWDLWEAALNAGILLDGIQPSARDTALQVPFGLAKEGNYCLPINADTCLTAEILPCSIGYTITNHSFTSGAITRRHGFCDSTGRAMRSMNLVALQTDFACDTSLKETLPITELYDKALRNNLGAT